MAESTGIAWTKSSWNPWIGCTKVSPGCDHCYAETLDARYRYGGAAHWGAGVPRYRSKSWGVPLGWNKKAGKSGERWTVFPSLCDPFDNEVPHQWRVDLFTLIADTPNLTWLLLTKRIGNAAKMLLPPLHWPWPNVWIGASVVNQEEADRDIPKLLATPAAKRFVSYEPALGPVDFTMFLKDPVLASLISTFPPGAFPLPAHLTPRSAIDWLIVGGESSQGGTMARPFDIAWARSAVLQCANAGTPCFVKQLGSTVVNTTVGPHGEWPRAPLTKGPGSDPNLWPNDLRVQEFPA